MLLDLASQERHTFLQLRKPIDAVLDADPAVKTGVVKRAKYRIIIIQPATNDAVPQPARVTSAVFLLAKIVQRALDQVSIAGMHRDHTMLHPIEELKRVLAGQISVARIIVNTEMR